jgi:hypothetical protein
MASCKSHFAEDMIRLLLRRYELSFRKEDDCVEYFIGDKATGKQISRALVFSLNRGSKEMHVSKFCPELYKEKECKYLSAACFYLVTHHFADVFQIPKEYRIHLETRPVTYNKFFSKLRHYHLHVEGLTLCKSAEVCGNHPQLDIDVSMIKEKVLEQGEVPFAV